MLPGSSYTWHFKQAEQTETMMFTPRHLTNNGMALLELARLGEGVALLDDYLVHRDLARGTLMRLLPDFHVNNTQQEAGMYATILDTSLIPTKIQLFLDFVATHVSGEGDRFNILEAETASMPVK